MNRRGFTIVEVVVTITIITIITVLAVASLRSSQVAARNDERDIKARTIASGLENYYKTGDRENGVPPGHFPDFTTFQNMLSSGDIDNWLTGVESSTLRFTWSSDDERNIEPYYNQSARNRNGDIVDITARAQDGRIIYEPLMPHPGLIVVGSDNDMYRACLYANEKCTRFNLYYIAEGTDELINVRGDNG